MKADILFYITCTATCTIAFTKGQNCKILDGPGLITGRDFQHTV